MEGKTKIESTTPESASTPQTRAAEALRDADWDQDVHAVLGDIEHAVQGTTGVGPRLVCIVQGSRRELLAALLSDEYADYSWASGAPMEYCNALLYCLLNDDWGNFARIAEKDPDLKAGLSRILKITDEEWDELRSDGPLVGDPFLESDRYVERLLRAC